MSDWTLHDISAVTMANMGEKEWREYRRAEAKRKAYQKERSEEFERMKRAEERAKESEK